MSNEIGHWSGGAGAQSENVFPGDSIGPIASAIYTAGPAQRITNVRCSIGANNSGATSVKIGLFETSSGQIGGAPVYTPVTVTISGTGVFSASVDWALTNGQTYALALGECASLIALTADTLTNGSDYDDLNGSLATFSHRSFKAVQVEIAGDVTSSGVTASGAGATATASAPAATAAGVIVKVTGHRLISKAGAPLTSLSGITALIHKTVPASAVPPDKVIASVTTNGSGIMSDLDISSIQGNNSDVWLTLMLPGSPNKGTTVRVTPVVS